MLKVDEVMKGNIALPLDIAEFEEVHKRLVKAVFTSKNKVEQGEYTWILCNLDVTVDLTDHQRIWYAIRSMTALMENTDLRHLLLTLPQWITWARHFRVAMTSISNNAPVPYYNVPLKEIPFDWQNV